MVCFFFLYHTLSTFFCVCSRVIVLEDGDIFHGVGGGYGIYNTAMTDVEEAVPRVLQTLQMEVESIMKVT